MQKCIAVFLLFCILSIAHGQECKQTLEGVVTDFHNGTVISGAQIRIKNSNVRLKSDQQGLFKTSNLCAGDYTLIVSHEECESIEMAVKLPLEQPLDVLLEHHIDLKALDLKGYSKTATTAIEQRVANDDLKANRSSELSNVLENLTGVSSFKTGQTISKPIINGLHSSRVVILNNGIRQEDQEWGVEHAPSVDINSFERIKVVQGSAALRYGGDAIGGVILADNTTPQSERLRGEVFTKLETNGRGGAVGGLLNKKWNNNIYIRFNGSYLRKGDLEAPQYILSNTGQQRVNLGVDFGQKTFEKGWSVNYNFYNNEVGILAASHIGNLRDLASAIEEDEPFIQRDFTYDIDAPRQNISHHMLNAKYYKRWKGLGKLELQYGYQNNHRKEFDRRRNAEENDRAATDLLLETHSASLNFIADSKDNFKWQSGIDFGYQVNKPNANTGIRRLIPDYDRLNGGLYLSAEKTFSKIKTEAGIRLDALHYDALKFYEEDDFFGQNYDQLFPDFFVRVEGGQYLLNPELTYWTPSAYLGAKYAKKGWTLNANYGLTQRAPNPAELFSDGLHHSAAIIEQGDLQLDAEQSHKFTLQINKVLGKHEFRATPFYQYIFNFINQIPSEAEQTIRGAFPVWAYTQNDARLYGIDAQWDWNINAQFTLRNTIEYVHGQDTTDDVPLIHMPPVQFKSNLFYTNENWLNLKANFGLHYTARQHRFPDYNFPITFFEDGQIVELDVDVSTPPSDYLLANFSVQLEPWKNWTAIAQIQNITNTEYRNYLNRLRYFVDDLGTNISIQIQYKF